MASPSLKRRLNAMDTISKPISSTSSTTRAFYELPVNKPTAARIVRESRDWLQAVSTRRPFTPKDQTRSLFGSAYRNVQSRPESAVKLSAKNFDPSDFPKAKNGGQLAPIKNSPQAVGGETDSSATPYISPTGSVRPGGRGGRMLRKFLHCDETLPSPRGPPGILTATDPGANRRVQRKHGGGHLVTPMVKETLSYPPKLELVGTQSKLISHVPPRNTSPLLSCARKTSASVENLAGNRNFALRHSTSMDVRLEPGIKKKNSQPRGLQASAGKFAFAQSNADSAVYSSLETPSENSDRKMVSPTSPLKLSVSSLNEEDAKSFPSARPNTQNSEDFLMLSPDDELHDPPGRAGMTTQTHSANVRGRPSAFEENFARPKLKSSGPFKRNGTSLEKCDLDLLGPSILTSGSGDSGLCSGTELDHLIARLSELSLNASKSAQNRSKEMEITTEDVQGDAVQDETRRSDTPKSADLEMDEETETEVINLVDRIYTALRDSGLQGKRNWPNRTALLQSVFPLLDRASPRLHLALARVILVVQVNDSNFTNVCKLIYKVAKDNRNDQLFLEHEDTLELLVSPLNSIDLDGISDGTEISDQPLVTLDALLFLTGTLKFLATSPLTSALLMSQPMFLPGLLNVHCEINERLCQSLLQPVNTSHENNSKELQHRFCHVLLQISEIFCHMSTLPSFRPKLLQTDGVLDQVIDCILYRNAEGSTSEVPTTQSAHYLVQFNWIRLLARLTEYADVCQCLDGYQEEREVPEGPEFVLGGEKQLNGNLEQSTNEKRGSQRVKSICQALMNMIKRSPDEMDLVVRVAYLLGNLTARLDSARDALFPNADAMVQLCTLCKHYQINRPEVRGEFKLLTTPCRVRSRFGNNAWSQTSSSGSNSSSNSKQSEKIAKIGSRAHSEVLDKLVRVLANATIGENVGQLAVVVPDCLDLLLNLISYESPWEPSELLLNCLAGLNNVTYYIGPERVPDLSTRQFDIAEVLLHTLDCGVAHPNVLLGVIRVFGNLTRHSGLRDWLVRRGGAVMLESSQSQVVGPFTNLPRTINAQNAFMYYLIQNLESSRPELVYSTLGVLINLMADVDQRPMFGQLGGLPRLTEALRDFAGHDWQLAGLACKTLWNYTEDPSEPIRNLIDDETLNELYELLVEFTDEEAVARIHRSFLVDDPTTGMDSVALWRAAWSSEFLPVATEFLSRLTKS
ncbi:unnamed protein product [Calicophoron daubneyi]|uniref:Armadillo repeat-containing protein 2 n=1 Tax=Calicophoron daubneyi TaxID=300641 RepID=A0AAV2TN65_CALDB